MVAFRYRGREIIQEDILYTAMMPTYASGDWRRRSDCAFISNAVVR